MMEVKAGRRGAWEDGLLGREFPILYSQHVSLCVSQMMEEDPSFLDRSITSFTTCMSTGNGSIIFMAKLVC